MDLRFPGFVANLKLGCMAETIRTELGKVRFNVARSLWIDHVAIFNNIRQVVPIGQCFDEWDYC